MKEVQDMKAMLTALLKHQNPEFISSAMKEKEKLEKQHSHKFSVTSLTHQFSMDETLQSMDESEHDTTTLMGNNSSDYRPGILGSFFGNLPRRKTSQISASELTHIQEEERSPGTSDSTDLESFRGDTNI